ncbi:MAG: GNAT family N-acetyltransferase [Pseudomonadota bacterium]|nr:GNAT family N-acetyltransferase [Pseudomonadota bacterium]
MSLLLRDDIVTPRLSLIAITPEMLLSEKNGDGRLGDLIQCVIPANWPPTDWEPHVLDFLLMQFAEHPEQLGWSRYVSVVPPDGRRALIGTLGAFTKASRRSECEIGYSILAPHEGQGFASEGARALIDYLRRNAWLSSIIAHSFPSLRASIRVMEKCGMVFDGEGEEPGTIRYRLQLQKLVNESETLGSSRF